MRQHFEAREDMILAPYAVKSSQSLGPVHPEAPSNTRTCFQRDRDRVIHSKAFRRLQHKTQVFISTESDHFRSRLTHTLEVAAVSRHLARLLCLNEDLAEVIALAHDLGHTPFGHSGERSLNKLMKPFGGFEHNQQSRRIVEILESKYPNFEGLNLSKEVLEGLMKHNAPWTNSDKKVSFMSLEAQIVNIADELTYNSHDIDDGLSSGILSETQLSKDLELFKTAKDQINHKYPQLEATKRQHLIHSYLMSQLIEDVYNTTKTNIEAHNIQTLNDIQALQTPIVTFSPQMKEESTKLRKYLSKNLYTHPKVLLMNNKGQHTIERLGDAYLKNPALLPPHIQEKIKTQAKERVIADYIAGMTDRFALKEYEDLFESR